MTLATQSPTAQRRDYLNTARDIGFKLARTALWDGGRCNWLGSVLQPHGGRFRIMQRTFGPDLYSGTGGVAYFLSLLQALEPDDLVRDTLIGACNQMVSVWDKTPELMNHSFYTGRIGVAFMLMQAGHILQEEHWVQRGLDILAGLKEIPFIAHEVDVISGAAGAIPALLKIHTRYPEPYIRQLAIKCGDFLLSLAEKGDKGWSWPMMPGQMGLTGYSHGTAGVGSAFIHLYRETGSAEYGQAAEQAFLYERHHFNPIQQNWPDLRTESRDSHSGEYLCAVSWCHGAPGIALSRMKAYQLTGTDIFRQEAEIALNTTVRAMPADFISPGAVQMNFSLCHGLAGNADILIEGARVFKQPGFMLWAEHVGQMGIAKYGRNHLPWPSGVSDPTGLESNLETPGLLLGLAGTGYFYLRLFDPERVESVLCI